MRPVCGTALLMFALPLHAQVTAVVHPQPDGAMEIEVRNASAQPLIAFALRAIDGNGVLDGPLIYYADSVFDDEAAPLPPGGERMVRQGRIVIRNGKRVSMMLGDPVITAGILADGSTGDPELVRGLTLRRANMVQAIEISVGMLTDAGGRNVPRDLLIRQFKRLADSVDRWYLPVEQQVGRPLFQSVIRKLLDLPEPPFGAAFPPSDFVAQETAAMARRRAALLESLSSLAAK